MQRISSSEWRLRTSYPTVEVTVNRIKLDKFSDPEFCFHITQNNDNIIGIARRYGIAPRGIVDLNKSLSHITQKSRFHAGTIVLLPRACEDKF